MPTPKERRLPAERILQYAKETFLSEVDALLADPSEIISGPSRKDPRVAIIKRSGLIHYHELARDLGMDFNVLIKERGDLYQRERLRRLLASEPSDHDTILEVVNARTLAEDAFKQQTKLIKKGNVS